MNKVATLVLATVNAPYGADLSAHQLVAMISDLASAFDFNAPVIAFFSEVSPTLPHEFIADMGLDGEEVSAVANQFAELSGYTMPLAA